VLRGGSSTCASLLALQGLQVQRLEPSSAALPALGRASSLCMPQPAQVPLPPASNQGPYLLLQQRVCRIGLVLIHGWLPPGQGRQVLSLSCLCKGVLLRCSVRGPRGMLVAPTRPW
jgi:hypothetical protein